MDAMRSAPNVSLHHAVTVSPDRLSRDPLFISGGRITRSIRHGGFTLDLRDHVIFPGLINAHDHLHVNAVPPLANGAPFANSYAWIGAFQAHMDAPEVRAALDVPKETRLRHGALKNLLAGTTCVAHHDPWHAAMDADDFPVTVLRDYGWSYALGWTDYGPPVQQSFADTPADWPWMIHLAEGTDTIAESELSKLDALGCLAANTVLIHGVGLCQRDIERVIEASAAVVWCPSSNIHLLGRTLDPRHLCHAGRLTLGSDSRLSGSRDLLDEIRGVMERGELKPAELLGLVTTQAARLLRLRARGDLNPGAFADMVIVEDRGGDVVNGLIGASRSDIRAVVRNGVPCIADPDFAAWFEVAGIEPVAVMLDGKLKWMDKSLAEPELIAMEPGLSLLECHDMPGRPAVAMEARC